MNNKIVLFLFLASVQLLSAMKKNPVELDPLKIKQKYYYHSAGIIPYTYDENFKAYLLLGRESKKGWTDFGGEREKNDTDNPTDTVCNPQITAAREFTEETHALFWKLKNNIPIKKQIDKSDIQNATEETLSHFIPGKTGLVRSTGHSGHWIYFVSFPKIDPEKFKTAPAGSGGNEKFEMRWVALDDLMQKINSSNTNSVRPFNDSNTSLFWKITRAFKTFANAKICIKYIQTIFNPGWQKKKLEQISYINIQKKFLKKEKSRLWKN